jgi:hypothetical protein
MVQRLLAAASCKPLGGPIGPGAVQLRLTDNSTANAFTAVDAAWETDPDRAQKEAAARRETAIREGVLVAQEANFRGNMATWTGIPPMPPSASPYETPTASTHCTATDVADHRVSIWTTRQDCDAWINEAQELAKSGPTARQVELYRIGECAKKLAETQIQSRSGNFGCSAHGIALGRADALARTRRKRLFIGCVHEESLTQEESIDRSPEFLFHFAEVKAER